MYAIKILDDSRMPAGRNFLLVRSERETFLFYRRSALCEATLEASWEAYREAVAADPRPSGPLPGLRSVS